MAKEFQWFCLTKPRPTKEKLEEIYDYINSVDNKDKKNTDLSREVHSKFGVYVSIQTNKTKNHD